MAASRVKVFPFYCAGFRQNLSPSVLAGGLDAEYGEFQGREGGGMVFGYVRKDEIPS